MTASSLTPLTRTTLTEHRNELARQRRADQEATEQQRMKNERALALQRGELRERERRLEEMQWRLDQERVALASQRDAQNLAAAETMLVEGDEARRQPVASKQTLAFAEQVIRQGQLRRAEIPDDSTMPPVGSTAWKIIMAARKARGEA